MSMSLVLSSIRLDSFRRVSTSHPGSDLLLEDSSYILLEDNSSTIVLE